MKSGDVIRLGHGGGGAMTRWLLDEVIRPALGGPPAELLDDAAVLRAPGEELAVTTDGYVVRPLFFPGGDIGKLAVCGTINDLAMQGAEPLALTIGIVAEEGLPIETLRRCLSSAGEMARQLSVKIIAGDTKVIERRTGDGLFLTTTGLGARYRGADTGVHRARPGDAVLVTGTMGDHGIAVMSARESWGLRAPLESDVAPLWPLVKALLDAVPDVHCLRDPTRGGLAAALNDIASASNVSIWVEEAALPIRPEVQGACDLLGLDPLSVANEGKAVIVCAASDVERALATLRAHPLGREAAVIGTVQQGPPAVVLRTKLGGKRRVEPPLGEELPRIC